MPSAPVLEQRLRQLEEELTGDGDVAVLARAPRRWTPACQDVTNRLVAARRRGGQPA
ncbi:MAG: hypothetical protein U0736_04995 [Gemmataceae bacterium]